MIKKQIKLFMVIILMFACLISPCVAKSNNSEEKKEVVDDVVTIENDSFILTYIKSEDKLSIKDKNSEAVWINTPDGEDEFAQGTISKELKSSIIVTYINEKNNTFSANSFISCVNKGTNNVFKTKEGLLIEYDFSRSKESFMIPVLYRLKKDSFSIEILFDRISEYSSNKICNIKLFPYFGAGKYDDDGFLFVPDGSGAIVDFKNNKSWADIYSKQIYGKDPAKSEYIYSSKDEQIFMPVYGIQRQKNSFIAVINSGDTNSEIEAIQSGYNSSYASVAPVFQYRIIDSMKMSDKYGTEKNITFESKKKVKTNPNVSFLFTQKGSYSLANMAKLYRDYMIKEEGLERIKSKKSSLFLNIYGVSQKKSSFMGLPVNETVAATDLQDLKNIVKDLSSNGIDNSVICLYDFNKYGTGNTVTTDFTLDKKIGSKNQFKKIIRESKELGFNFYYGINNIKIHKNKFLWWSFNSAAKNMFQTNLVENQYLESIKSVNKKNMLYFYLKPQKLSRTISDNNYKHFKNYGLDGLFFINSSSILYSDNKINSFSSRNSTSSFYQDWYKKALSNGTNLLADGANIYALQYSKYITNVPLQTSKFDICTHPVPFYQMVFHGLKNLASTPFNEMDNTNNIFLQCLLTGTAINYNLTGKSSVVLRDTMLNTLLTTNYKDWTNEICKYYKIYKNIHNQLADKFIIDYNYEENVEEVKYEDGTVIAANFGDSNAMYKGNVIKSGNFITYKE